MCQGLGFAGTAHSFDCRFPSTPDHPQRKNRMKRFTILLALLAGLGTACGNGNSTGIQNNPPNPDGLGPKALTLGTAGDYVILAKSGVSTTGTSSVVGDIGLSPAAATYVTGFALSSPPTTFTTSAQVTGKVWASNYAAPTPANLTTAILNMQAAYTDAAGRTSPNFTELGAGNIQGMTLVPGLYKWGTGVSIPSAVTLSGGANDVWIFQIAQNLTVSNGAIVTLSGGAQAKNVFWQVAGQATLGTTSDFKGVILSKTLIALNTGAAITGRALAQTAVTLNATAVTQP
jgi:Ice-binding-like